MDFFVVTYNMIYCLIRPTSFELFIFCLLWQFNFKGMIFVFFVVFDCTIYRNICLIAVFDYESKHVFVYFGFLLLCFFTLNKSKHFDVFDYEILRIFCHFVVLYSDIYRVFCDFVVLYSKFRRIFCLLACLTMKYIESLVCWLCFTIKYVETFVILLCLSLVFHTENIYRRKWNFTQRNLARNSPENNLHNQTLENPFIESMLTSGQFTENSLHLIICTYRGTCISKCQIFTCK